MKTKSCWGFSILLLASLALARVRAADTAVVKDAVINVRGQPTIFSEVVTQLKAGESVVILDEITIPKPKADEPAHWARIQLPVNTPVWVSAQFVDAETKTVKARHLNARAGAGENFSVIGRLEKGAAIKEIRKVDNWIEIEAPTNAYAFVAVNLLEKGVPKETPAAVVAATPTPPPADVPKIEAKPQAATPPPTVPQPVPQPPPTVQTIEKETPPAVAIAPPPTVPPPTAVVTLPAETAKPAESKPEPAVVTLPPVAPAEPKAQEPPPKRVITREGIVTSIVSIQAPTYFGLISPESRKTIDYIYSTATNHNLKRLVGSRVIVTGEEYMDARWPSTPVIKVDVLQLAPK